MGTFTEKGGLWVIAQFILLALIFWAGLQFRNQWSGTFSSVAGALFVLLGVLCGAMGAAALGRNLTPFPKPGQKNRLVQTGIYAHIRHPLYTAVLAAALGWALLVSSWPALLGVAGLAIFFRFKAAREEQFLKQIHPDYGAYERRVARFVPWVY